MRIRNIVLVLALLASFNIVLANNGVFGGAVGGAFNIAASVISSLIVVVGENKVLFARIFGAMIVFTIIPAVKSARGGDGNPLDRSTVTTGVIIGLTYLFFVPEVIQLGMLTFLSLFGVFFIFFRIYSLVKGLGGGDGEGGSLGIFTTWGALKQIFIGLLLILLGVFFSNFGGNIAEVVITGDFRGVKTYGTVTEVFFDRVRTPNFGDQFVGFSKILSEFIGGFLTIIGAILFLIGMIKSLLQFGSNKLGFSVNSLGVSPDYRPARATGSSSWRGNFNFKLESVEPAFLKPGVILRGTELTILGKGFVKNTFFYCFGTKLNGIDHDVNDFISELTKDFKKYKNFELFNTVHSSKEKATGKIGINFNCVPGDKLIVIGVRKSTGFFRKPSFVLSSEILIKIGGGPVDSSFNVNGIQDEEKWLDGGTLKDPDEPYGNKQKVIFKGNFPSIINFDENKAVILKRIGRRSPFNKEIEVNRKHITINAAKDELELDFQGVFNENKSDIENHDFLVSFKFLGSAGRKELPKEFERIRIRKFAQILKYETGAELGVQVSKVGVPGDFSLRIDLKEDNKKNFVFDETIGLDQYGFLFKNPLPVGGGPPEFRLGAFVVPGGGAGGGNLNSKSFHLFGGNPRIIIEGNADPDEVTTMIEGVKNAEKGFEILNIPCKYKNNK